MPIFTKKLFAEDYVVSSSVVSMSIAQASGSTIFGDTADDTHLFIGNTISGSATSTASFGKYENITSFDGAGGTETLFSGSATSTGSFGHIRMNGRNFPPQLFTIGSSMYMGDGGTGLSDDGSGNDNVGIGTEVLTGIANGAHNVAIGNNALKARTVGSNNVAIGQRAGGSDADDFGSHNILIGESAGLNINNTGTSNNVMIGQSAGTAITNSYKNTFVGNAAGSTITTGYQNVAIGNNAGLADGATAQTNQRSIFIGDAAKASADGNTNEIVIGKTTTGKGSNTVTIGNDDTTDFYITEGTQATLHTGTVSGSSTSTGSFGQVDVADIVHVNNLTIRGAGNNVAIGDDGTGESLTEGTYGSVAIGSHALSAHNGSNQNIAIGHNAMKERTAGSDTIAIGTSAGGISGGDVGDKNILLGVNAGYNLDGSGGTYNASSNVYIGYQSGDLATEGLKNTAVGAESGRELVAGSQNVFLGHYAGNGGNTDSGTFLGEYTTTAGGTTNETVIGNGAIGKGSHTVVLGDDRVTDIYMSEDVGATLHTGNVSGSSTSTGSFGHVMQDGKGLLPQFTTGGSIFIGENAGASDDGSNNRNIGIGKNALDAATTGQLNIAIGDDAIGQMQSGANQIAIGNQAMYQAGANGLDLDDNIAIGQTSLYSLEKGDYNIALGYQAMYQMESGSKNVAIGYQALGDNDNSGTGAELTSNVAIGANALGDLKNGTNNIAIGTNAMNSVEGTDSGNISGNIALGGALKNLEQGSNAAGFNGNDGGNFAAIDGAMGVVVSGSENIAIGTNALYGGGTNKDGGIRQVFLGYTAGRNSDGGRENIAVGFEAGYNVQGNQNAMYGYRAGKAVTTGTGNVHLGNAAGSNLQTGDYNVFIGRTQASATGVDDEIVIAAGQGNVTGAGTETIRIGVDSDHITNDFGENATWTHSSDKRIKKDIEDNTLGLEFINKLKTRTFKKKAPSEYPTEFDGYDAEVTERKNPNRKHYGFVAQEVKEAMDSVGHSDFPVWKENTDGMQELGETELITPLIKAVQELTKKVEEQQKEIEELTLYIIDLEKRIKDLENN